MRAAGELRAGTIRLALAAAHANAPHFRSHAFARAQLLELSDGATLAAAAYLLRYHARVARPDALPYDALVGACLFLACKARGRQLAHACAHARALTPRRPQVEECPRRVSDLLHARSRCRAARAAEPQPLPRCFALAAAQPPAGDDAPALAGEAYYAAKASLIEAEASLLRALRYDVDVSGAAPHKLLYNLAAALRAPRGVVRCAAALLRDACLRSRAALRHTPEALAAGALRCAAALLALPPLPPPGAAAALGLGGDAAVEAAAAELLQVAATELRICTLEDASASAADAAHAKATAPAAHAPPL